MYKDIISYQLADNVSKKDLLDAAKVVFNGWMKKQPGFIQWEIFQDKDGAFTDIVHWESKEAAKSAEKDMENIPNAADWYACYKEGSIASKNLSRVAAF